MLSRRYGNHSLVLKKNDTIGSVIAPESDKEIRPLSSHGPEVLYIRNGNNMILPHQF